MIFRSTDIHGQPVAASETVLTPTAAWHGGGRRPLLTVQPAYDSLGTQCDPSYTLQTSPTLAASTLTTINALLPTGVEIVIPDYEGPDALFGIGDQEGRIVLDGIKAAERSGLGGIGGSTKVVAFGYSGGGLATAWSAELQPTYAPGVNLVGAAEGGVAANIKKSITLLDGGPYAVLGLMALAAISRAYPHAGIHAALNAHGRAIFKQIGSSCSSTALMSRLAGVTLDSLTRQPNLLGSASLKPVFAALRLGQNPPRTSIFNFQGTADQVVGFTPDLHLVRYYCRQHVTVDFTAMRNATHLTALTAATASATEWLSNRLKGLPAPDNCASL